MHKEKITKFHLFELLSQNTNINLFDFLRMAGITRDEFIKIICDDEVIMSKQKLGLNTDTLTLKQLSTIDGYSISHLGRLRREGNLPIASTQNGNRGTIYFPILNVAAYLYIKTHPVEPGKITFSNLLREI